MQGGGCDSTAVGREVLMAAFNLANVYCSRVRVEVASIILNTIFLK